MTFSFILIEITDNSYEYDDGEGVFGSKFHYPYELSIVEHNPLHLNKEYIKIIVLFSFRYTQVIVQKSSKVMEILNKF